MLEMMVMLSGNVKVMTLSRSHGWPALISALAPYSFPIIEKGMFPNVYDEPLRCRFGV